MPVDWYPPVESGLNGDRSPEEDIEPWVDDLSDAREPGVYVVKCSTPSEWDTVERLWSKHYEVDPPDWVREAFESHVVLYVGGAKDVLGRLHQHLENANQSSALTRVFPLHSLWDVRWMDSAEQAFERESGVAIEIDERYPAIYVHQR